MASRHPRAHKIADKDGKARIRGGTRDAKESIFHEYPPGIMGYVNSIICGDASSVLSTLPEKSVDIIITSPPYASATHMPVTGTATPTTGTSISTGSTWSGRSVIVS